MQNHHRGNPRGGNRPYYGWRTQGSPAVYGSQNQLDETARNFSRTFVQAPAAYLRPNSSNGLNIGGRFNFEGVRHNRTSSTSSEQSHQRRNNSNNGHNQGRNSGTNWEQPQRGRNNSNGQNSQRRHSQGSAQQSRGRFAPSAMRSENSSTQRGRRSLGFRALQALVEKDSEGVILELSNSKRGFEEFLKADLSDDAIVLFTRALRKVSESAFLDNKFKILQTYFDDLFVGILTKYIASLPLQEQKEKRSNRFFWDKPDDFWNDLIKICGDILDALPTFAVKVLPKILKSLALYFPVFEEQHSVHVADDIKDHVRRMNQVLETQTQEIEEKEKAKLQRKLADEHEEEPPDDFRQISVYPNSIELISKSAVFLRRNIVKGRYRDVDQYLDIQFRLLREDFVGPLRKGIESYRSADPKKRMENVRIYKKVQFLNPETINEYYCVRLRFDFTNKKKSFSYENSRRFMYGSLLCFTRDNFRSFIFGKVAERKVEDLQKGELIVGFDENHDVALNADYVMVECSVFFEPYYHVLNVLKTMSVEGFPMEKYIIQVDSSLRPPEYLTQESSYVIESRRFCPLGPWPLRGFYGLNASQQAAFRAALTQEFTIIQGPPGTGKTYLGLRIAQTLLKNQTVWYKNTPMLVICFTNHALDQFLEGILQFTDNIMRVGGQSKNENLQKYNLRNRAKFKMNPAIYQQRETVKTNLTKIKNVSDNLKNMSFYHSIRKFDVFEDVVPNYRSTWFHSASEEQIVTWLFGGREDDLRVERADEAGAEVVGPEEPSKKEADDGNGAEDSDEDDDEGVDDAANWRVDDDDIFDDDVANVQCSFPLLTITSLQKRMIGLQNTLRNIEEVESLGEGLTFEELTLKERCHFEFLKIRDQYLYLHWRLEQGKRRTATNEAPRNVDLRNPNTMHADDRWALYFHWLDLYERKLRGKLELLNREFRESYKIYEEMRDIENSNAMKNVLVIGMTTTGAARLRSTLQTLKSPIVIVEEAAEVLEAHIVTSLTSHCKHLILIGDHQQLKPSTADFKIERHYNLGISLFERMVLNSIRCHTLDVQHRMRPEIADLIRPAIYPVLNDHESVLERPDVAGVDHNLFFVHHERQEAQCEGTSKKNLHEARFLIQLARHLVLNGHEPEHVTILAAYLGQMFELQKEKKKHKEVLGDVRISVLDNYQGEECDVILLSLVRNNEEGRIGFLSIENRVCVALSRARNGMYVMGNMDQLCTATDLWKKIRSTFEKQDALGPELALRCQVHRDNVTRVKDDRDFLAIPEGGCQLKCEADLACGHKCTSFCHIRDRDHREYRCRQTCAKTLCDTNPLHICKKMCFEECGPCTYRVQRSLPCGHDVYIECHLNPENYKCDVLLSTKLQCGHTADKPCHCDLETYKCPHPCDTKVEPCGHACMLKCHTKRDPDHLEYKCRKPCARHRKDCSVKDKGHLCQKLCFEECDPCTVMVQKRRTVCPHVYKVECNFDVDTMECEKPCGKMLPCGHKCRSKCNQPCGPCNIMVDKTVPACGHTVKAKCCAEPDRKLCKKKCPLMLPCGHACTAKCDQPCTSKCKVIVECALEGRCGHTITKIRCFMVGEAQSSESLMSYCTLACQDTLKCGHRCSGSCGACAQGRVHQRCADKCGVPLVCDHLCEFPCREACRPCTKNCSYECAHSKCRKKCGEVCTPCKEKCPRRCPHRVCTRFCGQICDVPPCEEPCKKRLNCGHPCVGFCGDPCPPKCMVCDREELTEAFLGFEDEDARYVLLQDCNHVVESAGLAMWLQQDQDKISFKVCPRCKTPIKTTQRFSDDIKRAMGDVAKAKVLLNGTPKDNEKQRVELKSKVALLMATSALLKLYCPKLETVFKTIQERLEVSRRGKRQAINKHDLTAITAKVQILEHVIKICCKQSVNLTDPKAIFLPQVKFILKNLMREEDFITEQETDDINLELNRLSRIVELSMIMKSPAYLNLMTNLEIRTYVDLLQEDLFNTKKFDEKHEEIVKHYLEKFSKVLRTGIWISETEKREIVKAMGFQKGHWYKCPNGHPYVIGECGGAMQISKCNECGARIGGTSHQLLSNNAVATEMDGALHGAWSDAANMANYDLDNIV